VFETLWPLTEGRRIEKTRYELPHGDVTIELDEFGGDLEGLLLAEAESTRRKPANSLRKPSGSDGT
jgi:CYTH domain-containing protein